MTEEEKNLDLLAVFHYVLGGITALFSCFSLIHVAVGLIFVFGKFEANNSPPPFFGWFFIFIGVSVLLFGWILALLIIIAGRKLKKRMSWTYCIAIGGLECMMMPLGTVLGVFTIIILSKDSVKQLFEARS